MKKITTINALRGLSALWVVLAHCGIWGGYKGYNPNAKVAVDIFMMASGFLMMYTVELVHNKDKSWVNFYIRRFFRLSPGYYVELALAIALAKYFVPSYHELGQLNNNIYLSKIVADFSVSNILIHITYLFGLFPQRSFSTMLPDWSLSLEMQFYLIFPLLFLFLKNGPSLFKISIWSGLAIILSLFARKYIMPHFSEVSLILYQLPMFLIGIFVYYGSRQSNKQRKIFSFGLAILFCFYGILIKDHRDNAYLLFAAVLLILSCNNNKLSSAINDFFDNKFFTILSDLSYSVYLFHGFYLSIIGAFIESRLYPLGYNANQCVSLIILCVIPLTYFTAYFSYKFIETPGIALGRLSIKKYNQSFGKC